MRWTLATLRPIADWVTTQHWTLANLRIDHGPLPWDFAAVAARYRAPQRRVLDLNTDAPGQAEAAYDLVLARDSAADPEIAWRVLRPGGVWVAARPGPGHFRTIVAPFGGPPPDWQGVAPLAQAWETRGGLVRGRAVYDVPFYFTDVESLLAWLMLTPFPADFDLARHWRPVAQILRDTRTPRGNATNAQQALLVAEKPEKP